MKTTAAIITLLASLAGIAVARAETVDLLLVLAADVSRSIDDGEFNLQRKGYAAAMTDPRVLRAIAGGRNHAIAITFIEWSGASDQNVVVDWTVVRDEEAAGGIAATMIAAPRSFLGRTSISAAIDYSLERLAAASPQAEKRIIDVSGDGTNNSGRPVTEARDQAVASGVTINGLAMSRRIYFDGLNLSLERGTGIATYTRLLAGLVRQLGYDVGVVYSSPHRPAKNPVLREIAFFDPNNAAPVPRHRRPYNWAVDQLSHIRGVKPMPVNLSGTVVTDQFQSRLPLRDQVFVSRNLFANARLYFSWSGRFTDL